NIPAGAGLFDAGSAVCDTPAYGRQELVRFVVEILEPLQPSQSYKQLPRVRWRALFTTNYDDLIEEAYQATSRVQTLQPVDLAYGYAILTGWPQDRTQPSDKMSMKKVIPVDGTFEEFAELVREVADGDVTTAARGPARPQSPATGKRVSVGKHVVTLTENQAGV